MSQQQEHGGEFRATWELLKPHVMPRRGVFVLITVLGAITAATQAVVLILILPVWSLVIFPSGGENGQAGEVPIKPNAITRAFERLGELVVDAGWTQDSRIGVLVSLTLIALLVALLAAASQYGFQCLSRWMSYRMIVDLRMRLARHLTGLSVRYHDQRKFGDLLSRLSADVGTSLAAIQVAFKKLLLEPLMALMALGVALLAAPVPALGVALLIPITVLPATKLTAKVRKRSTKSMAKLGASVQVLAQMFQGIRTVKAFGGEERELERYRQINESYLENSMRMVRAAALSHTWAAFFGIAGLALLVGVLGYLTITLELFDGGAEMTTFFLAVARLNNHVKHFTRAVTEVQESMGASVRIHELLQEPVDVVERRDARPISSLAGALRFENVSFRYAGSDADALCDVNLEIRPGENLALVGESGAGKSTLVDLVARFLDPTQGRITVDGVDLRDLRLRDWTSLYAMVSQSPFLFHTTIGENIHYGRPDATDEEVCRAAAAADIDGFIRSLPAGYDTGVADMGARLSGGQRQRITIARALLKGAPLLLLDEATSSLDSHSELEVQRALERLMNDRTVIVIAHRLATIQRADRIVVLEGGRIVEQGTHTELVSKGGAYGRLYSLQRLERVGEDQVELEPQQPTTALPSPGRGN